LQVAEEEMKLWDGDIKFDGQAIDQLIEVFLPVVNRNDGVVDICHQDTEEIRGQVEELGPFHFIIIRVLSKIRVGILNPFLFVGDPYYYLYIVEIPPVRFFAVRSCKHQELAFGRQGYFRIRDFQCGYHGNIFVNII
jgi:hypothetical protein